jgi:hypothetical protein
MVDGCLECTTITPFEDHLVRGYPIGTALIWRSRRSELPKLHRYRLIQEHQIDPTDE